MMAARPRNCSGVRSPRITLTWTAEKPACRCALDVGLARSARTPSRRRSGEPHEQRRRRRVGLLVVQEETVVDREVALGDPVALELLVDQLAHGLDADLVHQHLDAGARAVDAQPVLAVEDAEDGFGPLEVLAVLGGDEVDERRRDARHDRRAAAHADLEAAHAVALARDEGDVVDAGERAVRVRPREGRLDLARHQLRRRVADEVADVGAGVGRRVPQLVVADAGPRVGGHVADGVAAALAAGEARRRRSPGSAPPRRAAARDGSGCSAGW